MAINVSIKNMTTEYLPRHEILNWVNGTLDTNFQKIEELASGAAYCQFIDLLFPGIPDLISLKRVKFQTNLENDFIGNFRILQESLHKLKIEKKIPIEKLVRGRFAENFEFVQWFKKFFDRNYKGNYYNPSAARGGVSYGGPPTKASHPHPPPRQGHHKPKTRQMDETEPVKKSTPRVKPRFREPGARAIRRPCIKEDLSHLANMKNSKVEVLGVILADTKLSLEGVTRERNFYFGKLRYVELFCEGYKNKQDPAIQKVLEILYATEDGFGTNNHRDYDDDDLTNSLYRHQLQDHQINN